MCEISQWVQTRIAPWFQLSLATIKGCSRNPKSARCLSFSLQPAIGLGFCSSSLVSLSRIGHQWLGWGPAPQVDSYVANRDAALLQPHSNLGRVESTVTVLSQKIEDKLSLVWLHSSWRVRMRKEPNLFGNFLFTATPVGSNPQ